MTTETQRRFSGLVLRRVEDFVDRGLCFVFFGAAGSGKTPIAASAADSPYATPMLWIDVEGGTKSIAHLKGKNIDVVEPKSLQAIKRLMSELGKGPAVHGYKGVVIDNLSEIHKIAQKAHTKGNTPEGQTTQPEWMVINRDLIEIVEQARDMARFQDMVVIIITWDDNDKLDNGQVRKVLAFTPQVQKEMPGKVDVIGHISVNRDQTRTMSFTQGNHTQAKFRRSLDGEAQKIPLEITFDVNHLPMGDIINTLRGGEWPANKYKQGRNNQRTAAEVQQQEPPANAQALQQVVEQPAPDEGVSQPPQGETDASS